MEQYRGTTILSVRRGNRVALGGDGQVTLGNIVIKASARKVRTLYDGQILAGFAGGTADAFTSSSASRPSSTSIRATCYAARSSLPRTGALTARCAGSRPCSRWPTASIRWSSPATATCSSPSRGIVAIGSGGAYAQSAARALIENTELAPKDVVQGAFHRRRPASTPISATPSKCWIEAEERMTQMTPPEIVSELDKHIVGQGQGQKAVADRAAQPLAACAGG